MVSSPAQRLTSLRDSDPLFGALYERRGQDSIALTDLNHSLSYRQLYLALNMWVELLSKLPAQRLALSADNSIEWVLLDLAARFADKTLVPVPSFFSAEQLEGLLQQAEIECLFVASDGRRDAKASSLFRRLGFTLAADAVAPADAMSDSPFCRWHRTIALPSVRYPLGTSKVTFTSGTSAAPKGVCLSAEQQIQVAQSLADEVGQAGVDKHLCLLPLPVLLENIAGVYVPLLLGAQVLLPTLSSLGFSGSSKLDINTLVMALNQWQPQSLLLTPALLKLLLQLKLSGQPLPEFRYLALGGGATDADLVTQAQHQGLPVYEGYGLSECCSVVALNPYGKAKPGSVGMPLPHVQLSVSDDGEVMIADNSMLGYLEQAASEVSVIASGDLGYVDDTGYLYISGRKKDTIVTGFGRNVSPTWLEARLLTSPDLHQAWVYGDETTPITACVLAPNLSNAQLQLWLQQVNHTLPDYARIAGWRQIITPMNVNTGALTSHGRLRRHVLREQLAASPNLYFGERYELLSDAAVSNG